MKNRTNPKILIQSLGLILCVVAGVARLPAQGIGEENLALNSTRTGFPHPLESDSGCGGGSYPWDIVDGSRSYDTWGRGLAFTGGHTDGWNSSGWLAPCGPRQATINFGVNRTFSKVVVWHHGADHTPQAPTLEYWNGNAWGNISFTRVYGREEAPGTNSGNSTSDEYTFAPVTGSKVRYGFNNCGTNILGTPNIHGWIYEIEVFNQASCGDSYEPDDTAGTAKTISVGETQNRSICPAGNEDWARFTLTGPSNVVLRTGPRSGLVGGDTVMSLYGPNNSTTLVAYNDDFNSLWSQITVSNLSTGTYYVRVQEYGNNGTIGGYTLFLDATPVATGDSYEPDDTQAAAKVINDGETQNRNIHVAGNEDWARFTLSGSSTVVLRTGARSGFAGGDTVVWLYGPNNSTTQVAYNDDSNGSLWSQIIVSNLTAGTYYVRIQEYGNNGTIGGYTLFFDATPTRTNLGLNPAREGFPHPLESDSGWGGGSYPWDIVDGSRSYDTWARGLAFTGGHTDGWNSSGWLAPCGPRQATINFGVNRTFNKVVVWHHGADHTPQAPTLEYWNGSAWVNISFARVYGREEAPGTNSGNSTSDEYTFAPVTGSKVRYGFNNCGTSILGTPTIHGWIYEIEVFEQASCGDSYEPDDAVGTAKTISVGETQNRSICPAGNEDWARFTLTGPSNVLLRTGPRSGLVGGDTVMSLYGPNNSTTLVAYNDDFNSLWSQITVSNLSTGTYYVRIQEYGNNGTIGGYTLFLDATPVVARGVLVGRFTVNYRYNAAGRYTDQSRPDYAQANPYYGNFIPPGPIFINAAPGQYKVVVEAGAGCGVWSGDASRGTFFVTGHSPGEIVTFNHTFGEIALYYWDWYPYDNDPSVGTTISVYRDEGNLPDSYEPDDTQAAAKVINDGETQNRNIHVAGNEDWVRFTLGGPSNVVLRTGPRNALPGGDTVMWLYGPNSSTTQIAYNDDSNGLWSQITASNLAAGTYYVRIQEYGNNGTIGGYTLFFDATPVRTGDVFVGRFTVNYRYNAAGRYTDQSHPDYTQANPYYGNLIPPGPIFINATPGRYKLVVEAGAGCGVWSGDASHGTFLVTGHSPGEIVTLDHTFGQIALYYWDWYPFDNDPNLGTTISVYRIEGILPDTYEPDDTAATAKVINDNETQNRSIHVAGNQDWAQFTLTVPSAVLLRTGPRSGLSGGDTVIRLYGPNSSTTQVTYNDDANGTMWSEIRTDLPAGTYYVRVEEFGNNETINGYTLSLNTGATATQQIDLGASR